MAARRRESRDPGSGDVKRWLKRLLLAVIVLIVIGAAVVVIVLWRFNQPTKVPRDFVPPTLPSVDSSVSPAGGSLLAPGEIVFDSNRSGTYQIMVMAADGSNARALTDGEETDAWWPRPSPDRRKVLFNRTKAGSHDRDYAKVSLWLMNADGTDQILLRPAGLDGWVQQGHAEWSPDGKAIVMFGGSRFSPQIYLTDAVGQNPKNLTHRGGTNLDPSFSPDGQRVIFVGCPRSICKPSDYELYEVSLNDGELRRLTNDRIRDQDPYYSPDGSQIAWLSQLRGGDSEDPLGVWDVRIQSTEGGPIRLLAGDTEVTSRPIWSADAKSVLVHRLEKGKDTAFQLFRISIDETRKIERLTSGQAANEYPG